MNLKDFIFSLFNSRLTSISTIDGENIIGAPKILNNDNAIMFFIFKYFDGNIELFFIAPYIVIALYLVIIYFLY